MNINSFITMNYEQITMNDAIKNKPKQTQFQRQKNGASRAQGVDKNYSNGQTYKQILELFFFGNFQ